MSDEMRDRLAAALRACRVEDGSPAPLFREDDITHLTHMVTRALLPLLAEAEARGVERGRAEVRAIAERTYVTGDPIITEERP